jgi:hypothetical protein
MRLSSNGLNFFRFRNDRVRKVDVTTNAGPENMAKISFMPGWFGYI